MPGGHGGHAQTTILQRGRVGEQHQFMVATTVVTAQLVPAFGCVATTALIGAEPVRGDTMATCGYNLELASAAVTAEERKTLVVCVQPVKLLRRHID